jgi:2'-5' RNA ligase
MEAADMKKKSLTQLATQIITLRSKANGQQGGVVSTPTLPFFPDDHLLGEYAEPTYPQPLTYKSGGHSSAMIALFLPQSVGRKFLQGDSQALPLNELHLTIAYLGKAENLSHQQKKNAHYLTRMIAGIYPAMKGAINGYGRFCNGDDDGDPFFIVPDLPLLPELRHDIINSLKVEDINHASDHGFVPHITLTYLPHAEQNPFDALEKTPIIFPVISLVLGDERFDYPFASADNSPLCKADLIELVTKHLPRKHSQKTHAGQKGKGKKRADKKKTGDTASSISKELPANLGLMDRKKKTGLINRLSNLSTDELEKAFSENNKSLDNPKNDLELRNALIFGKMLEDATKKKTKKLKSKAALIEKIGARHTGAECDVIQKMHDLALELGAECHPLTRRAGARHSHADQGLVQRIHDDCAGLGAMCKALPEKDRVYGSQVLKETVTKAQSDAPNYAPASNPQRCANCRFFAGDPGRDSPQIRIIIAMIGKLRGPMRYRAMRRIRGIWRR